MLFFAGTPGPGAHYHVDNVDLSSWQVKIINCNISFPDPSPDFDWALVVMDLITGTAEGRKDLEASISTRVLDVLSWRD